MSSDIGGNELEEVGLTREGLEEVSAGYEKKELMEMTHEFIKEYVLAVDRKASYLMTGLFGLLGLGANALNIQSLTVTGPVLVPLALAATMGTLGIVFSGWVIYPRVYPPHNPGFIYWERIRQFGSRENFITAVEGMHDDQPLREITKNVYNTSDIASRKYGWLRWSMAATAGMFYFGAIAGLWYVGDSWILAVAFPTVVAAAVYLGLLAETQRTIAQSTATFGAGDDGELALAFEAGADSNLDVSVEQSSASRLVRMSGIEPSRRFVTVTNIAESKPRPWLTAIVGVGGYLLAVAATVSLTGSWPLAVSGPSLAAVAIAAGYVSGDKREVDQYDASFDVAGTTTVSFHVRALAADPDEITVNDTDDGPRIRISGLPQGHIVHVTDPEKTPYEIFRE